MPEVGCVSHTAAVLDQGGAVVCDLDALVNVEWGRVLDDTAQARITVLPSGDCCECAGQVRSWRHRLVIWRAGVAVFDGPVIVAEWTLGRLELVAMDASVWLDRRLPHNDMEFVTTDLADIAKALIDDAFLPSNPGVDVVILAPAGISGDRSYVADDGQTWEHLSDLGDTGLDWTTVGSRILLMGESFCEVVGSLDDGDFTDSLRIIEDGAALKTRSVFHGEDEVKGEAGGTDPYYGLLETDADEPSILDDASATAAASADVRASGSVPVFVDTGTGALAPTASVDVNVLVPGYCLEIATVATCRDVVAVQKIIEVRVSENEQGERVQVVTAPKGD